MTKIIIKKHFYTLWNNLKGTLSRSAIFWYVEVFYFQNQGKSKNPGASEELKSGYPEQYWDLKTGYQEQ